MVKAKIWDDKVRRASHHGIFGKSAILKLSFDAALGLSQERCGHVGILTYELKKTLQHFGENPLKWGMVKKSVTYF